MSTPTRMPRTRLRVLVAVLLAALVGGVLTPSTARAVGDPELTAFSVDAHPITVDDHLTVAYTVQATAPLDWLNVAWTSPSGRLVGGQTGAQPGLTGTIRVDFKDGMENGVYRLSFVELRTTGGGLRHYGRDGGPSGTGEHPFDFPAFDVTVSGSDYDVTAPLLTAVGVSPSSVQPGGPLTVTWTSAEQHRMTELWFEFVNDQPGQPARGEVVQVPSADLARGSTTKSLISTAINGRYTLSRIVTADSLGNRAAYEPTGSITPLGGNQPGGTRHGLTFADVHFDVAGSTADVAVPVLTSATVTPRPGRLGAPVGVKYVISDSSPSMQTVTFRYSSPDGFTEVSMQGATTAIPKSGTVTTFMDQLGTWKLQRIDLMDSAGNDLQLHRDGTSTSASGRFTGRHTTSFAGLDVVVEARVTLDRLRSRPQSAEVGWSLVWQDAQLVSGFRISVSPGGFTRHLAATKAEQYRLLVPGLTNGVKYTVSVSPEYGSEVGAAQRGTVVPAMSGNVISAGDVNGDRRPDLLAHLPDGPTRLYFGKGPSTWGGGKTVLDIGDARIFPNGRLDGRATFLLRHSNGSLNAEHLAYNGSALGGTPIGLGWSHRFIDGSADFTGDGRTDIVAVTVGGVGYVYRGRGDGTYSKGSQVASGWSTLQALFASPDVTGDRRADLLAVDRDGVLWIYPGTGKGTFGAKRKVAAGWGGLGAVFHVGDATGDGRNDLGAVTTRGTLRIYPGRGNGTFGSATTVSSGWSAYL